MTDKKSPHERKDGSSRDERLKAALRENLKKRKLQARGRAGITIVTPDDDARAQDADRSRRDTDGGETAK